MTKAINQNYSTAIVGSGPAGLMAAEVISAAGLSVSIFEKRKGPSWKLYIAGSSGLNITNSLPTDEMLRYYSGPEELWRSILENFTPRDWLRFIEEDLGIGTFLGTSQRYFVETMHAALLVRQWRRRLESRGVMFLFDHEWQGLERNSEGQWHLNFRGQASQKCAALGLCLGGASWESEAVAWPEVLAAKDIRCVPFTAANTGFEVEWPAALKIEAEGLPLKNIELKTSLGKKRGDLIITSYGLEGTPIYFYGTPGRATIDLKPDLEPAALLAKLSKSRENLSLLRRAQKVLNLSPASRALLFHLLPPHARDDINAFVAHLKALPLELRGPRPLSESISSRGGVAWTEVDPSLMLRKCPSVFLAGEMLDWEAPTGGFLIQGCVSQGRWMGQEIVRSLAR